MEANSLVTLILASISGILLIYNFVLGRKLNNQRDKDIEEVEGKIKESKNETKKLTGELSNLIEQYRKLREKQRDSDISNQ